MILCQADPRPSLDETDRSGPRIARPPGAGRRARERPHLWTRQGPTRRGLDLLLPVVRDAAARRRLPALGPGRSHPAARPGDELLPRARPLLGLGPGVTRFYVYRPFDDIADADWAALLAPLRGVQVLAQTANVARAKAAHFAGVYTYDIVTYGPASFVHLCAGAHRAGLLCDPSVG